MSNLSKNRLKVLRAERDLAQYKFARLAGIETTRYWRIENALVTPTSDEQQCIAAALGVTIRRIWPRVRRASAATAPPANGAEALQALTVQTKR